MAIALLLSLLTAVAQEFVETPSNKVKAYVKADLTSRYMWRGKDLGHISIVPEAGISWSGLSFSAAGKFGFDKDDNEKIDLKLQFERWGVRIGVTDYYTTGTDTEGRYFYYDSKKGNHQFEGFLGYKCRYGSLTAYTMFLGNDWKIDGADRAYSTYIELNVPFYFATIDWDISAGVTPFESAGKINRVYFDTAVGQQYVDKKEYFYADGFTCTKAAIRATKRLTLGDVKMPVYVELHANPYLQKAQLLIGVTVEPF